MAVSSLSSTSVAARLNAPKSPFLERAAKPAESPKTEAGRRQATQVFGFDSPTKAKHADRTPEILRLNAADNSPNALKKFTNASSVNDIIQRARFARSLQRQEPEVRLSAPPTINPTSSAESSAAEKSARTEPDTRVTLESSASEKPQPTEPPKKAPKENVTNIDPTRAQNSGGRVNITV